jgi:AbrB family looped-hinge helix DNA binding protein
MIFTMITTMDAAGRLVLPKAARTRARFRPGVPLEVRVVDGRIEIEPAAAVVTVEQRNGFWVAASAERLPPLTQDHVDQTIDDLRGPTADDAGDEG